jgi:acetylornithine deacetylase/succinyl-diaminopimelate desuccinylase-like protein
VVELLTEAGLEDVRTVPMEGSGAAIFGELRGPEDGPTVLLYAHYDVQPASAEEWDTPPFKLTERDGRLYGRGAADDKSGVVAHVAALTALRGAPPVNLKVVIEGGEENEFDALTEYVREHPAWFADADVVLVADSGPWYAGDPMITTSLRGGGNIVVEVSTLESAVHSGDFGGAVPDALTALARLLATLHDDDGNLAVEGLTGGEWEGAGLDEEGFRRSAGMLDGVRLIGSGSLASRLWSQPAISVIGIDGPAVRGAPSAIVPSASAKLNLRTPPGLDPLAARDAVAAHLTANAPWGAQVDVRAEAPMPALAVPTSGPAVQAALATFGDAYGKPANTMGAGGSIPLAAELQRVAPAAEILLVGAEDSDKCNMHGPNESVAVADLERFALAEILLLAELGRGRQA